MKKIATLLLLVAFTAGLAQDKDKRFERIKALRIAFISDRLDLTTEEAEKFWPVFNKFDDKQKELHDQKKQLLFKMKTENTRSMSDSATLKLIEESELIETNLQNNRKEFIKRLQGVISPQKILLLKKIEDEFKEKLLKQFKKRQEKRNND